jgi:hypothetical protein
MIRFVFRLLGLVALATAFFFVVYDGEQFIVNHHFVYTKVSGAWAMVDQTGHGLNRLEDSLRQKAPWAWDPYVQTLLEAPVSLVLVIAALILMLLGRKKKPLIGYARN